MPDPYIIVSGGLVQNDPALPVFDLDCLDDRFPDSATYEEVANLRRRLNEHGLVDLVYECDTWLLDHASLDPDREDEDPNEHQDTRQERSPEGR